LISIGFATHRVSHPDHYKVFELIQYIYNNRLIMTLEYENEIAEAHHHRADHGHFCFTTAEEFHRDDEALAMLTHMAQMIAEHNQRQSGRHHEHHDESYRGKFSFKH
jgi:hypothetical protein